MTATVIGRRIADSAPGRLTTLLRRTLWVDGLSVLALAVPFVAASSWAEEMLGIAGDLLVVVGCVTLGIVAFLLATARSAMPPSATVRGVLVINAVWLAGDAEPQPDGDRASGQRVDATPQLGRERQIDAQP